jgi:hypothetical protein
MIENKQIPNEYVSIRQIWLQNIIRCSEAISNRAKPDASHEAEWQEIGAKTVIFSIKAMYFTLVDYGEALIQTEVKKYKSEIINPQLKGKRSAYSIADIYEQLFVKILEVLNKYNMLFEQQPEGYTNVTLEVVK